MKMKITNAEELDSAILHLQQKAEIQKNGIAQQVNEIVESLKPANLLRSAVNNIAEKPGLVSAAMGTTVAMGAGALTKKLIVGRSGGIFKKIVGGLLEFTVSRGVANNFGVIADKGIRLLKRMSR